MKITVAWDNPEQTIIRYDFAQGWTWEDLFAAVAEDDSLMDSVDHDVHIIFNVQDASVPPNPLSRLRGLSGQINPKLGLLVVVATDAWFHRVTEIFYSVYGKNLEGLAGVHRADTLADARQIIAAHG
jgi:hypothetical protein